MRFEKWHALGNAYLVIERQLQPLEPSLVQRLCDVAVGIGSDGVVEVVEASNAGMAEVVIWNPDGSVAETSGNGLRIAARWLAERDQVDEVIVRSGSRAAHARMLGGLDAELDMGEVTIADSELLEVGDLSLELTAVSVGNPHAVVRRDGATRDDLLDIGPVLERHSRFPNRTNVQLVEPIGPNELRVLVWERGAGETSASGSSATAAAAVAVARGWCVSPVTAHLPGGDLVVTLAGSQASLLGPAARICSGDTTF